MTVLITRKETDKKEKQIENIDNKRNKERLWCFRIALELLYFKGINNSERFRDNSRSFARQRRAKLYNNNSNQPSYQR